jgi:hypothetical protein
VTNAPIGRRTHVIRILGTNRDGEILQDVWADVERIDKFLISSQAPGEKKGHNWQEVTIKFRWMDDPDDPDNYEEDGNPNREYEIIKVCDPTEEDLSDPEVWVPVPAIKRFKLSKINGMTTQKRFLGKVLDDVNVTEARRINHYDTNIDADAQAAFDADPTRKVYVVKGSKYTRDDDTKDEDQYVEHEIVTRINKQDSHNLESNGNDQERFLRLKNQYLIDESDEAQFNEVGEENRNPPYRLDPFQNIVNVQLTPAQELMVGMVTTANEFSSLVSSDGTKWVDEFGGSTSTAASGLGRTVVTSEQTFVCFGKPIDGNRCFIKVDQSGIIERGVLKDGQLEWTKIGSIPVVEDEGDTVQSCSFAGDIFFISYRKNQNDESLLAVSLNGTSFSMGINPWPGVVGAANGSGEDGNRTADPVGGCVAYDPDKELYVTTGIYTRSYRVEYDNFGVPSSAGFFDENFMSSKSSDGISWTPFFETSEATGIGGPGSGDGKIGGPNGVTVSSVTFGNGIFVATGSVKQVVHFGGHPDTYLYRWKAAAIISDDGANWSSAVMPDQVVDLSDTSVGSAVKFVKKRGEESDGFFVMATSKSGTANTNSFFMSTDGVSWNQVHSDSSALGWVMSIINKNRGQIVFV